MKRLVCAAAYEGGREAQIKKSGVKPLFFALSQLGVSKTVYQGVDAPSLFAQRTVVHGAALIIGNIILVEHCVDGLAFHLVYCAENRGYSHEHAAIIVGSLQSGKLSVIHSGSKYFNEETF